MAQPNLRLVSGHSFLKERLLRLYSLRARNDAAGFAAGFAADGVFCIVGDPRILGEAGPRRGREAIAQVVAECHRSFPAIDALIVDLIVDLDVAVVRRHLTVSSTATGAVGEFDIADFITFRDGEITEFLQFIDTASLALLAGRM